MVSRLRYRLVVASYLFLSGVIHLDAEPRRHSRRHIVHAGNGKGVRTVAEIEFIRRTEGTFRHRKIIDGIHQVRLSFSIIAGNAIDIPGELEFLKCDVPEIPDGYSS